MAKVSVEFVHTCSCCDGPSNMIKTVAKEYGDLVDIVIYHAGRDFDYLKKYGNITRGTMIINGQKKYENLSPDIIREAIAEAVKT